MNASSSTCMTPLYIQSLRNLLFILNVHSYSFFPFLYNLTRQILTQLNVFLFYLIELILLKNI